MGDGRGGGGEEAGRAETRRRVSTPTEEGESTAASYINKSNSRFGCLSHHSVMEMWFSGADSTFRGGGGAGGGVEGRLCVCVEGGGVFFIPVSTNSSDAQTSLAVCSVVLQCTKFVTGCVQPGSLCTQSAVSVTNDNSVTASCSAGVTPLARCCNGPNCNSLKQE